MLKNWLKGCLAKWVRRAFKVPAFGLLSPGSSFQHHPEIVGFRISIVQLAGVVLLLSLSLRPVRNLVALGGTGVLGGYWLTAGPLAALGGSVFQVHLKSFVFIEFSGSEL